jgi:hypothetical protein
MAMRITTKVLATLTLAAGVLGFGWLGLPGTTDPRATAAPLPELKKATPEVPPAGYQLLRLGKVQKELKCTADQRVALIDHFDDQADARAKGAVAAPPVVIQGGNVNAIRQQIQAQMKERQDAEEAENKVAAAKVLKPEQLARLVEIELHVRGAEAFTDAKVADALKLTDDQKKAVADAIEGAKGEGNLPAAAALPGLPAAPVLPPAGRGGGVVVRGFVTGGPVDAKARKAAYEKATETLTKDQQAAWKKLTGEPPAFDPHALHTGSGSGSITVRGGIMAAPAMPVMPAVPVAPPKKDDK